MMSVLREERSLNALFSGLSGIICPSILIRVCPRDVRFTRGAKGISRNWHFQYSRNGDARIMTLGKCSAVTAQAAREQARQHYAAVLQKRDPLREVQAAGIDHDSFGQIVTLYLAAKKDDLRESTFIEATRYLTEYAKRLHNRPLINITRADIADLLNDIARNNGSTPANRTRSNLSSLFTWAQRQGKAESNPVSFTEKREEKSRDRVLTDAELAAIWNAAGDGDYGTIVKMLILTGQRREEIGGLRWSEIAGDTINLPPNRTKNGKAHFVPLSGPVRGLLPARTGRDHVFGRGDGADGFAGWSAAKAALDKRLGDTVAPWRLHDLRHTLSTQMHEKGVAPHVVEAIINHISGHKAGVAGRYNHANYSAERKAALDMWAKHVLSLVGPKPKPVAKAGASARPRPHKAAA
jgi:integrase